MADQDDLGALARRAVDIAVRFTTRAALFAFAVTMVVVVVVVTSFLLGVAALDGGAETVWIALGGTFAVIAIGAAALATWRVGSVRRHAGALVAEMKRLVTRDPQARRTVIETVEVDETGPGSQAVILSSRSSGSFTTFGTVLRGQTDDFPELARAVAAVTTFPVLLLVTAVVTVVFSGLAFIWLLALAL